MIQCPECDAQLPDEAQFCKTCGIRVGHSLKAGDTGVFHFGPYDLWMEDGIIRVRTTDVRALKEDIHGFSEAMRTLALAHGGRALVLYEWEYVVSLPNSDKAGIRKDLVEIYLDSEAFSKFAHVYPYGFYRIQIRLKGLYSGLKSLVREVGFNKEIDLKIFKDIEKAEDWLKSNKRSTRFGF